MASPLQLAVGPRPSKEQDKSSDIEQQPPFGDRKISNIQPQIRRGGVKTNRNRNKEDYLQIFKCVSF